MNGADVVAEILKREGTEFLACYPRNPLIDACAALDIRPILCRQERMGVGMADGFSRIPAGFPAERQYITPTFRAAEVYAPVTKYSAMASSVQELPQVMRRAYQAMRSGKPGPVLIEVPNPVFDATFEGTLDYKPVPVLRSAPDPDAVKEAARLL